MAPEVYELVALGMRYWFVLLGLVIVWRALRWAWMDHHQNLRRLSALPYAGLMGEIVNLDTGHSYPLPREGVLGSGKACDVRLPGLRKREFEFVLREGRGVALLPSHRQHQVQLNGQPLDMTAYALHGARIGLPGYQLRMRLFAGLDVPQPRHHAEAVSHEEETPDAFDMGSLAGFDVVEGFPLTEPAMPELTGQPGTAADLEMTWIHALPPPELYQQPPADQPQPVPRRRSRRSRRHEQ